jgi:hypothetical protein
LGDKHHGEPHRAMLDPLIDALLADDIVDPIP